MRAPLTLLLVLVSALGALACGASLEGHVRRAAETDRVPDDFVVIYDDHEGERGGVTLTLRADGTLEAARFSPGQSETEAARWSGPAPDGTLAAVLDLLVAIEAWEQRAEPEEGRLESAKARLTVRLGGERASIWEWASDLEATGRIVRVKQHLEAIAFELRHPLVDGAGGSIGGDVGP